VEGGEITEHDFAISPNAFFARGVHLFPAPVGQNQPPALHAAVTIVLAPASHWVQNFPAGERQAV
jgi:hypothetical protein